MRFGSIRRLAALAWMLGLGSAAGADIEKVVVAGATGSTGRLVVARLLDSGYTVRAFVRDPAKARKLFGDDLELVQGDVKSPDDVVAAVEGMDALISALGSSGSGDTAEMIEYQGIRNIADAAVEAGLQQVVLISSRGVTQEDHPLNAMFDNVLKWKLKGEDALRASGVPYTIVRPGGLINKPGGEGDLLFEQGDPPVGQMLIPRADVAAICVAALRYPQARFKTFETHRIPGDPPDDWRARFAALKADGT